MEGGDVGFKQFGPMLRQNEVDREREDLVWSTGQDEAKCSLCNFLVGEGRRHYIKGGG